MNTYTLEQIAHFDRCLFPGDFRDSLIEHGIPVDDAMEVARFIIGQRRKGNNVGIINVYQEYISWTELHEAIEKILQSFIGR